MFRPTTAQRAFASAFVLAFVGACGAPEVENNDTDDGCGPNSSYSEEHEHCHCDEGFEIQGTACLPIDDSDEDGAGAIDLSSAVISGQSGTDQSGAGVYLVQAVAGRTVLRIEGYVGFGAPDGPASFTLSGAELDYKTCAVCVVVETGCDAHDDHFHCSGAMMPSSGQVDFTSLTLGGDIAGALHEVSLREVAIAEDFATTAIEGGTTASIEHWDFAAALEAR